MIALTATNETWRFVACRALAAVWRGAAYSSLAPVRLQNVNAGQPPPDWCKVRVTQCGLCASDLHLIHAMVSPSVAPSAVLGNPRSRCILGHELVGVIEQSPEPSLPVGTRIVSRSGGFRNCFNLKMPPCRFCAGGEYAHCINQGASSPAHEPWRSGGFASTYHEPGANLLPVPDALSDDEALLAEPLACALRAVLRLRDIRPKRVLVIGAGLQGLGAIHWLKHLLPETSVHVQARHAFQADLARVLGASQVQITAAKPAAWAASLDVPVARGIGGHDLLLDGFDAVIDSIATPAALNFALRVTKPGGKIVVLGAHLFPGRLDYSPIWFREITVTGVYAHGPENCDGQPTNTLALALRLLSTTARLPVALVTHRLPLADYRRAAGLMSAKSASRAVRIALNP